MVNGREAHPMLEGDPELIEWLRQFNQELIDAAEHDKIIPAEGAVIISLGKEQFSMALGTTVDDDAGHQYYDESIPVEYQYYDDGRPISSQSVEDVEGAEWADWVDGGEIIVNTAEIAHHGLHIAGTVMGNTSGAHHLAANLQIIPVAGIIMGSVGIGFTAYEMVHVNHHMHAKAKNIKDFEELKGQLREQIALCRTETDKLEFYRKYLELDAKVAEELLATQTYGKNLSYGAGRIAVGVMGVGVAVGGLLAGASAPLWLPFAGIGIGIAAISLTVQQRKHRHKNPHLKWTSLVEIQRPTTGDHSVLANLTE